MRPRAGAWWSCVLTAAVAWGGPIEAWIQRRVAEQRASEGGPPQSRPVVWQGDMNASVDALQGFVPPASFAPLIRLVSPSVVSIEVQRGTGRRTVGAGIVVDAAGTAVTNHHLVRGAARVTVRSSDGRQLDAEVRGADADADLAVLSITGGEALRPAPLGDSDGLEVGEWVLAVGNPFGLEGSASHGIVSATERIVGEGPFGDFLQIDAPINPGNSGGAVVDMAGRVVGMTTAVVRQGQGIAFAVPVNLIRELLPNILRNGRILRGWLGASVEERSADGELAPVISELVPGAPAALAGLRVGDRILSVDGRSTGSFRALLRRMAAQPPGATLRLGIGRERARLEVPVVLAQRPTSGSPPERGPAAQSEDVRGPAVGGNEPPSSP